MREYCLILLGVGFSSLSWALAWLYWMVFALILRSVRLVAETVLDLFFVARLCIPRRLVDRKDP